MVRQRACSTIFSVTKWVEFGERPSGSPLGRYEGGEGGTATSRHQRCPELMGSRSYNQLSCHVDATLAEIDMERFCRADIDRILEISAYSSDLYGVGGIYSLLMVFCTL